MVLMEEWGRWLGILSESQENQEGKKKEREPERERETEREPERERHTEREL